MRVVNKNDKTVYKYGTHRFADGVLSAIILYAVAVLLLVVSVVISYLYLGEAPTFVAGIGISSMLFNLASMINIILEIYLYKNFHAEIRNLLLLQILLFSIWIFMI